MKAEGCSSITTTFPSSGIHSGRTEIRNKDSLLTLLLYIFHEIETSDFTSMKSELI